MIIFALLVFAVGVLSGIFTCDLMYEKAEAGNKCGYSKFQNGLISGLYMGCAYLCVPRYFSFCIDTEVLVIFCAMFILSIAAIQDMLEHEVYSVVLNCGIIGVIGVRTFLILIDDGLYELITFFIIAGAVYLYLFIVRKTFPKFMGEGDYDVIYIIYLLAGDDGFGYILFASCVLGLVIYLPAILSKKISLKDDIPYVPVLYMGTLVYYLI